MLFSWDRKTKEVQLSDLSLRVKIKKGVVPTAAVAGYFGFCGFFAYQVTRRSCVRNNMLLLNQMLTRLYYEKKKLV